MAEKVVPPRFAVLHGAVYEEIDGERTYTPTHPVYVNPRHVVAFYSHTILTANNKIRVMENEDEIRAALEEVRYY